MVEAVEADIQDQKLLFNRWDMSEVEIKDPSLARYVNLHAMIVPHSCGKLAGQQFNKSNILIVERLIIKVGGVLSQAIRSIERLEAVIPGIPDMIGLRDHVVHVYWNIDVDRVWNLVVTKAPELARLLRNLLAEQAPPLPERRVQR